MLKVRAVLFFFFGFLLIAASQPASVIKGQVIDKEHGDAVKGAVVSVEGSSLWSVTDSLGFFNVKVADALQSRLQIVCLGYQTSVFTISENGSYYLTPQPFALDAVVVTASESEGLTSSSKIENHAMEHLQPSSIADMMELLPGGKSSDPDLNNPNSVHIREIPLENSDYATSSLGTSFVIDGAPISTNGNMQSLGSASDAQTANRSFANKGVDLRTISTDNIKSVEIVRGIPSVEYGDLTSGLVKIERKKGGNSLSARFKADMKSKLYYVAKGFEWEPLGISWNLSADYLNAKSDPRNVLENYKRITLSSRFAKRWDSSWGDVSLAYNLDYSASADDDKEDPDLNNGNVSAYKSSYNRYAASMSLLAKPKNIPYVKSFSLTASSSLQLDFMSRTSLVQLQRDTPAPDAIVPGEHDSQPLPYSYTATHSVDGKPFSAFAKANAILSMPWLSKNNTLKVGIDWLLDKNFGDGQIFDVTRPLYSSSTIRPRSFSEIPSTHNLALYAEESIKLKIGRHALETSFGVRGNSLLNLSDRYTMNGKMYFDPRVNVRWNFPSFMVWGEPVNVGISGGVGQHTKMPTILQLYPSLVYLDLVQLNYYHINPKFRRINIITYVDDPTNYTLDPARNLKWEVRGDVSIGGNRLTVTYFEENMASGFRSSAVYNSYALKKYDASSIDGSKITSAPSLSDLPYTQTNELHGYTITTNGSQTLKRGIEYTFSSNRIEAIQTRVTISGAWMKTTYRNSQPVIKQPSVVINNERLQYAGIYADDDGYIREMSNTNFTFDTDLPSLGLGISASAQCVWSSSQQSMRKNGVPTQYIDSDGVVHDYVSEDQNDPLLRWLVYNYSASQFAKYVVPFYMEINLKATKRLLENKMTAALFVNKLINYAPNYVSNGFTIRRTTSPYFGVELNVRI